MSLFQLNPLTVKKINRFKSIRRGYYSFIIFVILVLLSCFAEVLVNSRALLVSYEGSLYFPTYGAIIPGKTLGLDYEYETNYRDLQKILKEKGNGFVVMPPIPFDPYENDLRDGEFPPFAPSFEEGHYLGTDTIARDVAARLVYGFRTAIFFSLILLVVSYLIGVSIGAAMGYFGGLFDLLFQRIIEIWSNIPFLYVIMIISSIMIPNFFTLIAIVLLFGWIQMTWYMRTVTYKEKAREYVMAARALGASNARVIFNHILPNTVSIIITFIPFSVASGIIALTSLDYLGFGLPAPTPSWGELLSQGSNNLESIWIVSSVIVAMTIILVMVTFIGEAIREAFDPKKHTTYE
ncbi:MAG: ABC transporter permease subunit [Gammaproteobacteria bacterium]|nr:ABC transporter permease subunit [Gammaproteobacteria bacterium]